MGRRTAASAPPPPDERPDRDLIDDPDLVELTSRLPEARKVSIKEMSERGNWKHKGSVTIDSFNLDNVQRRFGGGLYQFTFHAADGKTVKTISNIEIDDLPADERETVAPALTVSERPSSSIEEMMRLQLAQQQTMILKLIESIGARQQPQSNIVELVTALSQLKSLEPKHERPPEVQELVLKSFTQGLELAAKAQGRVSGESSPTTEILGFVRDVFKEAQPLITSMLTKQNPPAKPAAPGVTTIALGNPPEVSEEMDEQGEDLKAAVSFIKDQLKVGIPPAVLAKLVLNQMESNPETKEDVTAIVMEQPIEEIVALDEELGVEPMRTQFGEFFGVLRAQLSADAPTA